MQRGHASRPTVCYSCKLKLPLATCESWRWTIHPRLRVRRDAEKYAEAYYTRRATASVESDNKTGEKGRQGNCNSNDSSDLDECQGPSRELKPLRSSRRTTVSLRTWVARCEHACRLLLSTSFLIELPSRCAISLDCWQCWSLCRSPQPCALSARRARTTTVAAARIARRASTRMRRAPHRAPTAPVGAMVIVLECRSASRARRASLRPSKNRPAPLHARCARRGNTQASLPSKHASSAPPISTTKLRDRPRARNAPRRARDARRGRNDWSARRARASVPSARGGSSRRSWDSHQRCAKAARRVRTKMPKGSSRARPVRWACTLGRRGFRYANRASAGSGPPQALPRARGKP